MLKKIRYYFNIFNEIFSWVLLIGMLIIAGITTVNYIDAKESGDVAFIFGYRPIQVQTGSMEPYMMTNSFAWTKEVTDISQLKVGDVISFHLDTEEGNIIRITHRIIDIADNIIYTKGDNNKVADNYPLTIDNIESKVITVFNQPAWLISKWESSLNGKIFITSCLIAIILFAASVKMYIKAYFDDKISNAETNDIRDKNETDSI